MKVALGDGNNACRNRLPEQIAIIKAAAVMDLSNCWKAIIGFMDNSAIKKPAVKSTNRVS